MDPETIKQQTELEVESLSQISSVLHATLSWKIKPKQLARKISSVRFVTQSFQRYLERLFALEEHDGYMQVVTDQRPHWSDRVLALRLQHGEFRDAIRRITTRLERVTPEERATFENLCHELLELTEKVEKHNRKENALLEDALLFDDGGEG